MLLCIFLYFYAEHIIAQSIIFKNLTDIIELTTMEPIDAYFAQMSPVATYVDMENRSNYYWITTFKQKGVVSNIYDINKFIQYNNTKNSNLSSSLPFEIGINDTHQVGDTMIGQCKSPSDNNIITCYSDTKAIKCTIFNDTNNTLSSQFTVNHPSADRQVCSPQILCKHDEYIIFYAKSHELAGYANFDNTISYTSLSIGGDVLSMDIDLNIDDLLPDGPLDQLKVTSFNDSIFLIVASVGMFPDQPCAWIGYYDHNENNNSYTIKVKNPFSSFTIDFLISFDIITLNVSNNCCFMMVDVEYEIPINMASYVLIIDIDGNLLSHKESPNDLFWVPFGSIVELQMINNISSNSKYFLIAYSNMNESTEKIDTMVGDIYRLSYDANTILKYETKLIDSIVLQGLPPGQTSAGDAVLSNLNNQLLTITFYTNDTHYNTAFMYSQLWNITVN